jgi:hypothetical protein
MNLHSRVPPPLLWLPFFLVLMLATVSLGARPESNVMDLTKKLREAETLSIRDKTTAAIDAYETLLDRGVDFPGLRYNLGTLYLQKGDIGAAVLHLLTAKRQDPNLPDVRHNLDAAFAQRDDTVSSGRTSTWIVSRWIREMSPSQVGWCFVICLLCFLFIFALQTWPPRRPRLQMYKRRSCLVLGLLCLGSFAVLLEKQNQDQESIGVVLQSDVPARKGPGDDAAISLRANSGLFGTIVESQNGYDRLRLENGFDVWISQKHLGYVGGTKRGGEG